MALLLAACTADALPLGATSADCGVCHADHYAEWARSGHGQSTSGPVFQALLPHVEDAWGTHARQTCEGCHAPGYAGEEAIGCVACHAAVGNHAERDGQLAVDLDEPLSGPLGGVVTEAHVSTQRSLLTSPVLCGTCHEVTGPELLVESTLSEFRASGEEGCLECHAPTTTRAWTDASEPRDTRAHTFVGFDPPWDDVADPDAAEATRQLLARALELRIDTLPDGRREVVVTNVDAGHRVPTGVSFVRDIWVDVTVDGVEARVLTISDQPMFEGEPTALLTDADDVKVGSLGPGEELRAAIPVGATAMLKARAVRGDVLDALGLDLALPAHTIARAE
jgi:hypothetical protein